MLKKLIYILMISFFMLGCEVKPKPISYGQDGCHFCKMTIVDNQHAALLVTKKGKTFKYDAIECMLNDLKSRDLNEIAIFQVADYQNPGKMIDAKTANFMISELMPSPMGANLSASVDNLWSSEILADGEGEDHSWETLIKKFGINHQDNH